MRFYIIYYRFIVTPFPSNIFYLDTDKKAVVIITFSLLPTSSPCLQSKYHSKARDWSLATPPARDCCSLIGQSAEETHAKSVAENGNIKHRHETWFVQFHNQWVPNTESQLMFEVFTVFSKVLKG